MSQHIQIIDSHTGGEPTRIIVGGGPDLGPGSLADQVIRFRNQHDAIRRAVVMEPRGSDVMVGGIWLPPKHPESTAGVIFFNNLDYLGMCGHGTIGLMATLKHLGQIEDGTHRIETPVGIVTTEVLGHETTMENIPSFRLTANVAVDVPGFGTVIGDVAWGGNWFFLVREPQQPLSMQSVPRLLEYTSSIRDALQEQGITGTDDAWIDHIELFGPPKNPANDSQNFVLCPGGAYDRSPCGTGTSAKLACLAADGRLLPGQPWRQEGIVGSTFVGSYHFPEDVTGLPPGAVLPTIQGTAFVNGQATLILNPDDPFCMGIPQ